MVVIWVIVFDGRRRYWTHLHCTFSLDMVDMETAFVYYVHHFTANLGGSARHSEIVQAISAIRHMRVHILNRCTTFVILLPVSA